MKLAFFKLSKWIAAFAVLVTVIFLIGGCAPANHPPVITNLKAEPETLPSSGSCWIECVASDEDGDELSYEWFASEGDINGNGAAVNWSAPESEGIYNITVEVTDGNGGEVTDSIAITVRVNRLPTITSLIADKDWLTPLGSCHIRCNAEDSDGDKLSYEWSASGGGISGAGSAVTWTAPETEGLHNITVVVTDGYGGEDTRTLTVSVSPNPPPVIEDLIVTPKEPKYMKESSGDYVILKSKTCEIKCIATSASGELNYEWLANGDNTDGGQISGEGSVITWTAPSQSDEVTVTVTVSDSSGGVATKSTIFTVLTSTCSCTYE